MPKHVTQTDLDNGIDISSANFADGMYVAGVAATGAIRTDPFYSRDETITDAVVSGGVLTVVAGFTLAPSYTEDLVSWATGTQSSCDRHVQMIVHDGRPLAVDRMGAYARFSGNVAFETGTISLPPNGLLFPTRCLTNFGTGTFIAGYGDIVGQGQSVEGVFGFSPDGENYAYQGIGLDDAAASQLNSAIEHDGKIVAVGLNSATTDNFYLITDPTLTFVTGVICTSAEAHFHRIVLSGSRILTAGSKWDASAPIYAFSDDGGYVWTTGSITDVSPFAVHDVAAFDGLYYAVGVNTSSVGVFASSSDGVSWSTGEIGPNFGTLYDGDAILRLAVHGSTLVVVSAAAIAYLESGSWVFPTSKTELALIADSGVHSVNKFYPDSGVIVPLGESVEFTPSDPSFDPTEISDGYIGIYGGNAQLEMYSQPNYDGSVTIRANESNGAVADIGLEVNQESPGYDGLHMIMYGSGTSQISPTGRSDSAVISAPSLLSITCPNIELTGSVVAGGDIEASGSVNGIILTSPNGTRYRITVTDGSNLVTTPV